MLALLFFAIACSSTPKTAGISSGSRESLFPFGTYQHKVELKISVANSQTREVSLDGVVALKSDRVQVIGLSGFGTTEFKIYEDRTTGKITIETFREALKKAEPKILEYYSVLRLLLSAKMRGPGEFSDQVSGTKFYLSDFDKNSIPMKLEMIHPAFSAKIKVVGYEI